MIDALQPGAVFEREWVVRHPLGAGGMGRLYVVEQQSTGALRALKLMHAGIAHDPRACARFLEEARVGARIESDHIVQVIAAGVVRESGAPWLVMELLQGEDLAAWVAREGLLPPAEARSVLEQTGHALGAAHRAGVVHCDLKPENIMVGASRSVGAPRSVKVLDFGIARSLRADQSAAVMTTAMGSPLWMAPEQAQRGALIRPSADVWALGLLAFWLRTGRFYWRGAQGADEAFNLPALLVEVMVEPLAPAAERAAEYGVGPRLPAGFDAWFARCVVRDPAARFRDATEAIAALWVCWEGAAAPPRQAVVVAPTVTLASPPRTPGTTLEPPPETIAWGRVALIGGLVLVALLWVFAVGLRDPGLHR
jgi:serine/threonine protein kinase